MVNVSLFLHPLSSVPSTTYVVVDAGVNATLSVTTLLGSLTSLHT